MKNSNNQLRIIAGQWRSRKLKFPDIKGLRPTPDRVRETLFNWLAPIIEGSTCLDLFAGSGALSFEALSRGAALAVLVEQSPKVVVQLKQNAELLQCDNIEIHLKDALRFISKPAAQKFNVIFLDPPFHKNLVEKSLVLLEENNYLDTKTYIYIEQEKNLPPPNIENKQITKTQSAGEVTAYLLRGKDSC